MYKYSRNKDSKQRSQHLTLQEVLHIIAIKTGPNPKQSGRSYQACCPAHEDKHASLSIAQGNDRTVMFCHVGCSIYEICSSLGIHVDDLKME